MRLVFISNYFNYHQKSISDTFFSLCDEYKFISTEKMDNDRLIMGWGENKDPEYVIAYYENQQLCKNILLDYDIVIFGSVAYEIIKPRLVSGKITFFYSERIFKDKKSSIVNFLRAIKYIHQFRRFKNIYLLAASGYAAGDYASIGCFKNKALKWGYFPETKIYDDTSALICQKVPNSILWCGRFLDWKHPEMCIKLAEYLLEQHCTFKIKMVGVGPAKDTIVNDVMNKGLKEVIEVLDPLPPDQVRSLMEKSKIYVFTSDRYEGWGAVLNEAMNSCCAVVASSEIGSVPFLLESGTNGYSYSNNDYTDLGSKVKELLYNEDKCVQFGHNAYNTIANLWNASSAAEKLIEISDRLLKTEELTYAINGPCSKT